MFVPPLKIGEVISNERLMQIFKVANMGGMQNSKTYDVLVLISNHALKRSNPEFAPFDDKWIDGVFYYTGEGSDGDQPNPPVKQHNPFCSDNYSGLYLFEVFRRGEFTYQGPVKLAGTSMYGTQHPNGIQPDRNGNLRKVWIFPLRKLE